MTLITTCPMCWRQHEEDSEAERTTCPKCGHWYYLDADYLDEPRLESDPDYGGAFDGHTVTSDADPGL